MADRKTSRPGASETQQLPQETAPLDKDESWQARLDEARARREIALRQKGGAPKPQKRVMPWEEEAPARPPRAEITPIVQDKPADEKPLDLADRLEKTKAARSTETRRPPVKMAPPRVVAPAPEEKPAPDPAPIPRIVPQYRKTGPAQGAASDRPAAETPPARPKRDTSLVAPGAPDVIDLAHRYASTLKPPVNVTGGFDPLEPDPAPAPQPQPAPEPVQTLAPPMRAHRRPFGIGIAVILLALVPLTQTAPPLDHGPAPAAAPFFGLPPALGLTTSMVWPIRRTEAGDWVPGAVPARPESLPLLDVSPLDQTAQPSRAPELTTVPLGFDAGGLDPLSDDVAPDRAPVAPLVAAPDPDEGAAPLSAPTPRPRPQLLPPVDPREDAALDAPLRPGAPLRVTILAPSASQMAAAERIGADAAARGHEVLRIRRADLSVSTANLRYFHAEDRAEALRLARVYGAELRDFTWFEPAPLKGTAELWLAGRGPAPAPGPRGIEAGPGTPGVGGQGALRLSAPLGGQIRPQSN